MALHGGAAWWRCVVALHALRAPGVHVHGVHACVQAVGWCVSEC
jgi:hypothetical protein